MAKETAEKKLLKLIESTESQETAAGQPTTSSQNPQQVLNSVKSIGISGISLPPFLSNLSGLLKGFFPQPAEAGRPAEAFGLKQLNQILLVSVILIISYLAFDVAGGLKI